jgi:UPF0716 protein FxsA
MGFRWVWASLGIIALALPALELVAIYQVWGVLGAWTLAWLALAALAGFWLMALERLAFLPRVVATLAGGGSPWGILTGSGLRFVGAGLLIFPGPLSDALGLLLLLASLIPGGARAGRDAPPMGAPRHGPRAANDDIIEGEYKRVD